MHTPKDTSTKFEPAAPETPKPGFFSRIFTKLDSTMKEKAEQQAQNSCCSEQDKKNGKCC